MPVGIIGGKAGQVSTVVSYQSFGLVALLTVPVVQDKAFEQFDLLTVPVVLARCPPWCRTNPSGRRNCSPCRWCSASAFGLVALLTLPVVLARPSGWWSCST